LKLRDLDLVLFKLIKDQGLHSDITKYVLFYFL